MSTISEGILAGAKLASLAEELKLNQLQRMQYEQSIGHVQTMQSLQEAQGQSALKLSGLQSALAQNELDVANETKQSRVESAKLGPDKARAELVQTGALTAESQARTQHDVADTRGQVLRNLLGEQGYASSVGAAGGGAAEAQGKDFTLQDASSLAVHAMDQAGVKYKEGDATHQLWTNGILSQANEIKTQRSEEQQKNAIYAAHAHLDQANTLALTASQLSQDPGGMIDTAVKSGLVEPMVGQTAKAIIERGGIQSPGVQRAEVRQPDDAFTKQLKENLAAQASTIAELSSKTKPSKSEQKDLDAAKVKSATLQQQLEDYMGGKKAPAPTKGVSSPTKPAASPGPKVGDVIQGYRFKGGAPGDPRSWERVK